MISQLRQRVIIAPRLRPTALASCSVRPCLCSPTVYRLPIAKDARYTSAVRPTQPGFGEYGAVEARGPGVPEGLWAISPPDHSIEACASIGVCVCGLRKHRHDHNSEIEPKRPIINVV